MKKSISVVHYFKVIWNEFFQEVRAWNMSFFWSNVIWWQGQVIFIAWWPSPRMQLYPQCSVMMRNTKMLGCYFFCRHFFSTKTMPGSRCLDRDSDDVAPLAAPWKMMWRARLNNISPTHRRVNNKQKPHCCLSAQGLRGNAARRCGLL